MSVRIIKIMKHKAVCVNNNLCVKQEIFKVRYLKWKIKKRGGILCK